MEIVISVILSLATTIAVIACSWGKLRQGFDDLKERFDKFETDIRSDLKECIKEISQHGADICTLKNAYGISGSPMNPSELGKKLLTSSGFYKMYPELKDEIFALMDSENLRTLYDYEKGAEKALIKLQNNPAMDPLKEYAVNHHDESLELIFKVAAWVIRDDYAGYKSGK